jgi:NADH dehydrogenase [ubiquinone] 1 alpha subcomplex assembly factor 7
MANSLSELIAKVNGAALIIDYGENHAFNDSVRAIRKHKFIDNEFLLEFPGEVDLSCYVNFLSMSHAAKQVKGIKTSGPIP